MPSKFFQQNYQTFIQLNIRLNETFLFLAVFDFLMNKSKNNADAAKRHKKNNPTRAGVSSGSVSKAQAHEKGWH